MSAHRRFMLVTNELAGSADGDAVQEALSVLRSGGPTEVVEVGSGASADGVVDALDGHTVVVAGGDGTVHAVLGALRGGGVLDDVLVGLIPLGTGNDLARSVGIPSAAAAAARLVLDGQGRPMDLLDLHGEPVVNAAHFGLGVAAARAASSFKALGPVAYAVGGVVAGLTEEPLQARVTVDGHVVVDGPVTVGAVMSGFSVGGGTALCPPARPDDGQLDVVVVDGMPRRARARFGAALRRGAHLLRADTHHRAGEVVEVHTSGPLNVNVDGEIKALPEQWTAEVVPGAWRLIRSR